MKPREFEEKVAEYFKAKGYETELTPYSGDWGIDVIAIKGTEKVAVQAKMYGDSRKVNREAMMQLDGAMRYQDCTKAVMVTDGEVMEDAMKVAEKLGIEVVYLNENLPKKEKTKVKEIDTVNKENSPGIMPFNNMWEKYIIPLKGKTLNDGRKSNTILEVNAGGIMRITSTGNMNNISIEDFKKAYGLLQRKRNVTRDEINQLNPKRNSSGIVLVLSQVPFINVRKTSNATIISIREENNKKNNCTKHL